MNNLYFKYVIITIPNEVMIIVLVLASVNHWGHCTVVNERTYFLVMQIFNDVKGT